MCPWFRNYGSLAFYGTVEPDEERFKVLHRAYELGQNFWDSADVYQDSEDLIGKWFKHRKERRDIPGHQVCEQEHIWGRKEDGG